MKLEESTTKRFLYEYLQQYVTLQYANNSIHNECWDESQPTPCYPFI